MHRFFKNFAHCITICSCLFLVSACGEKEKEETGEKTPSRSGLPSGGGTLPTGNLPGSKLTRQPDYVPPTSEDMSAQTSKPECQRSDVKRIRVAIHPSQPDRGSFNFAYQHVINNAQQPTVVFITGGPGQDSIDDLSYDKIPKPLNVLNVDPRSMGCSPYRGSEDDLNGGVTSENYADDIIAVIKSMNLTNYLIYGVSYGTLVATMLAHKIEQQPMIPPKAVVLQGIIGRPDDDGFAPHVQQWSTILSRQPNIERLFYGRSGYLGYNDQQWMDMIELALSFYPARFEKTMATIANAPLNVRFQYEQNYREFFNYLAETPIEIPGKDFHRVIQCREYNMHLNNKFKSMRFYQGRLILEVVNNDYCRNLAMDRPYDASRYPIKSPIYYIQGDRDPNTPIPGARHHFDSQPQKNNKKFIEVRNAGHGPWNVELKPCKANLWMAMANVQEVQPLINSNTGRCLNDDGVNSFSNSDNDFLDRRDLIY